MKKFLSLLMLCLFLNINYGFTQIATENMEHLTQTKKVAKKSPTNLVVKTPAYAKILENNILEVTFGQDFTTKTAQVGDGIDFMLNEGLKTTEGSLILPEGTVLKADIIGIEKPKSFNRSGKVTLKFNCFQLPNGTQVPLKAKLYGNKAFLSRGKLNALGKGLGSTLGGMAVGIGAGCGIGVAASAVIVGGFAIGLPVGVAVGAIAGLVTPGLHYKAKAGDKILIQLTDDVEIK